MPAAAQKFLIVDDNPDSRFLLVKTLLRKFPQAVVQECQQSDPAVAIARSENPTVIIAHRTEDADGIMLIRLLRRVNTTVPIVMVSGYDRGKEALEAGATRFLNYDEWLRIGTMVAEMINDPAATASPFPAARVQRA
jgi:CheY-like chemotaxis protein